MDDISVQLAIALRTSLVLRVLAWASLLLVTLSAIWASERLARKLDGTKDNAAHGKSLHRKRIRQYAWRRATAVVLGVMLPGIVLSAFLLFPKTLLDSGYEAALRCPNSSPCDNGSLALAFIADQVLKGALSDLAEVFQLGVGGYDLDLDHFAVRAAISVYRLILNVYGLAAMFLLGRVAIDRIFIGISIGRSDGKKLYLNLSGLSRGGLVSGYVDESSGVSVDESANATRQR